MEEMQLAVDAATTPGVKMWMNWMLFIFLLSIVFVWKHVAARYVLGAFFLTVPIAILVFNLTQSAHLIGISHILLWGPLAYFLFRREVKAVSFKPASPYGVWLILLLCTITISLVFDVRDIALVMQGMK